MLCRNSWVDAWIEVRRKEKLSLPRQEGCFVLVTEKLMEHFEKYREELRALTPSSQTLLYPNSLVLKWIKEANISHGFISFKAITYIFFPHERVDDFIEWIEGARLKYGPSSESVTVDHSTA